MLPNTLIGQAGQDNMFARTLRVCIDNGLCVHALKGLRNVCTCTHCKMHNTLTRTCAAKYAQALIQSILDYAAAFGGALPP